MSKTITSPVKRFPGTVVISDPLTLPQAIAMDEAMAAAREIEPMRQRSLVMLPGLCACVDEWHLEGLGQLTPQTFPATPPAAATNLLTWLFHEIMALYQDDDPNP